MKVYTTEQAANILNVTVRTIYNYIASGSLKAFKMGRTWRVLESDLVEFIKKQPSNRESQ